jgi:hypothetical protein
MTKYTHDQRMQVLSVCSDYLEGKLSFNSAENKIRSLVPSYPVKNLNQQISSLKKCLSGKGSYGFAYPATWAKALIELFGKNSKVIAALKEQQELYYARDGRKNMALEKLLMNHMVSKKINHHELLRITGHQDYKSWPSLQLDHEPPGDRNEEKRVFSLIDNFCRKQGKRISGVYLYERKGEVLYIGKGKPIFNRVKSHYNESYREVSGDTKTKKWHRFFSKYNGPITVYISEIGREADRKIVEMILQEFHQTVFSKFE